MNSRQPRTRCMLRTEEIDWIEAAASHARVHVRGRLLADGHTLRLGRSYRGALLGR